MKIKLSKSQWNKMGKKAGWIKTAGFEKYESIIDNFIMQAIKRNSLGPEYNDSVALGALKMATALSLAAIEDAVVTGKQLLNSQSVIDLGAKEIIDKIVTGNQNENKIK